MPMQDHRARMIMDYCHTTDPKTGLPAAERDAVEPLSHEASPWMHKPFDVAETRTCIADGLGRTPWLAY